MHDVRTRYRLAAALLILGAAVLRLAYLIFDCPLDLAPDEAHYWDWSRRLDWSYYSKGPLIAWIIAGSRWLFGAWSVELVGSEMLAVRLPAVVFGSLLLTSLYVLTVQVFRREALALALVAGALMTPMIAAGSLLMTIDSPYTCLWSWALVVGNWALFGQNRRGDDREKGSEGERESMSVPLPLSTSTPLPCSPAPRLAVWCLLGLLVGLGMLAKYTMVLFLPFLALFLAATPSQRHWLRRPGPWLVALVGAICCLPIVIWNAQHDWVTLRHTEGHAGLQSQTVIHWLGPLRYLGTQFGILLGFWFVLWAWVMWRHRPGRETRPERLYLWWLSAPMFVFFGLFSFKNGGGEPNWPVTAYLAGMVLTAGVIAEQFPHMTSTRKRWLGGAILGFTAVGLMLSVVVHRTTWVRPLLLRIAGPVTERRPMPLRTIDPTARLRGWRTLAGEVDRLRERLRNDGVEPVLAAGSWTVPGELGVYCAGQPTVYSLGQALGERHSQYDLWRPNPIDDPEQFHGKSFLMVGVPTHALSTAFTHLEPTQIITHSEAGQPIAQWWITIGHGYRGLAKTNNSRAY